MKKAFTMMEMLLVLMVIGILAAVLISSFSGGSDAAHGAKCMANLRSLAVACQSYALGNEYQEYPCAGSMKIYIARTKHSEATTQDREGQGWIGWHSEDKVGKYISPLSNDVKQRQESLENGKLWSSIEGDKSIYHCPGHASYAMNKLGGMLKEPPAWSYVMNGYFGWDTSGQASAYRHGVKITALTQADKRLMFAELPWRDIPATQGGFSQSFNPDQEGQQANDPILQYYQGVAGKSHEEVIGFNHRGSGRGYYANIVFADGHTERITLPKRARRENMKNLTKWLCAPSANTDIVLTGDEYRQQ